MTANREEMFAPGRLWSLWDLVTKFNLEAVLAMYGLLNGISGAAPSADGSDDKNKFVHRKDLPEGQRYNFPALTAEWIYEQIVPGRDEINKSDFPITVKYINNMIEYIEKEYAIKYVKEQAGFAAARLSDEMEGKFFLYMPGHSVALYEQDSPPFSEEVASKFPAAAEDISEAGKCLSLGRYTGGVFHLMRVMELGLRAFGKRLDVTVIDKHGGDLMWGPMCANIGVAINLMPQGEEKTQLYVVHTYLVAVGKVWRNPTMHPKQTYTEEEAKDIFSAVRVFLMDLASLV